MVDRRASNDLSRKDGGSIPVARSTMDRRIQFPLREVPDSLRPLAHATPSKSLSARALSLRVSGIRRLEIPSCTSAVAATRAAWDRPLRNGGRERRFFACAKLANLRKRLSIPLS
jgi:hypothetical protein